MVNHSIATGMLILVIGMVIARGGSTKIADYGGMSKLTRCWPACSWWPA